MHGPLFSQIGLLVLALVDGDVIIFTHRPLLWILTWDGMAEDTAEGERLFTFHCWLLEHIHETIDIDRANTLLKKRLV